MSQRLHLNGLDLRLETTSFEFTLSTRRFIRREFRRLRFRRYDQITLNAPHCVFSRMACDADEDEGNWVCCCCIRFLAPAWHGDGFYQIGSFLTASSSLRPSVNNHARGVVFKRRPSSSGFPYKCLDGQFAIMTHVRKIQTVAERAAGGGVFRRSLRRIRVESPLQRRPLSAHSDHPPGCPRTRKEAFHDAMGAHTFLVERS